MSSQLRDFRSDSRMLILAALAVPAGIVSALMAKFLLWLLAVITNYVFFQKYSPVLGRWSITTSALVILRCPRVR